MTGASGSTARVRDIPAVLLTAGGLFARHWPALLTLAFLGSAVRAGAIWLAVVVSDHNAFAAQLVLVLAPLGYLLPIIAMLHLCRGSLTHVSALDASEGPIAPTEGRERRLVDVTVSMIVPFLAVYVSYGLLNEDRQRFINEAAFREHNQFNLARPPDVDFIGRLGIYSWQVVLAIVALAWVTRWAIGRFEHASRFLALAFVGALVEVYWTTQVTRRVTGIQGSAVEWLEERRATAGVVDTYDSLTAGLGPLGNPIETVTGWIFEMVGALDAVVVVPLAWLTVGAVVLGHKLAPPTPPATGSTRWQRIPPVVRRTSSSLLSDLSERWSAFWGGLRLLAGAGLLPMLVFGVMFLIVLRVPWVVSLVWRTVAGPVDTDTWLAFAPMERTAGLALSMALTAPMLAAAVEWLVAARRAEAPSVTESPGVTSQEAAGPRSPAD